MKTLTFKILYLLKCAQFISVLLIILVSPMMTLFNKKILISKELNHFGVIAGLFRQIGGHSSRFVLFCSFWRLFTIIIKMIKSVKVFSLFFLKKINIFLRHKIKPWHKDAKWPPSYLTPWTLTLRRAEKAMVLEKI